MFIVNITFCVPPEVQGAWLDCVNKMVIPQLQQTPYCGELLLTRVLHDTPQPDHSYSLQVHIAHATDVQKFNDDCLSEIAHTMQLAFPEKVFFFKTVLKKIEHG